MKLLVIRHAIAMDRDAFHKINADDGQRPLTSDGIRKMKKNALGLQRLCPHIDVLATSPLVRAVQTAEIVSSVYGHLAFRKRHEIKPEKHPMHLLEWLRNLPTDDVGVGHMSEDERRISLAVRTSGKSAVRSTSKRKSEGSGGGRLTVAVVGHEPNLSQMIGYLVTGSPESVFELRKGGACLLEFKKSLEPGNASLEWLLKPSLLRALRN